MPSLTKTNNASTTSATSTKKTQIHKIHKIHKKTSKPKRITRHLVRHVVAKPSKLHGFGAFATKRINKGDVLEECVALDVPTKVADENILSDYVFETTEDDTYKIILGYGSIYNHSYQPNVEHRFSKDYDNVIEFFARNDIKQGEECFINYGKGYWKGKKQPLKPQD